ncbi:MAG: hypothetical protein HQK56_20950 [Deltaproteobacteria bacterium]|nr:hypothetical protein [Deltaproteobacteria bacterium]
MSLSATYLSSTQFRVTNDLTISDFPVGMRVKSDCGVDGFKYGFVIESIYSSPNTTVTVNGDALTSNLTQVWHGADEPNSLPAHASVHAKSGRDAITPSSIGAPTVGQSIAYAIAIG